MTLQEVLTELQSFADPQTKKTLMRHGGIEPLYGVKVEHLKKIQKKIKKQQELALELYDSGIYDAMYLAGLVVDGSKMTKAQIQDWADKAKAEWICDFTVSGAAIQNAEGYTLAKEWIDADQESLTRIGWSTLAQWVGSKDDKDLDIKDLASLLKRVEVRIHTAANRERYSMNSFVIALGAGVAELTEEAEAAAKRIGKVTVDMGDTACKVPDAFSYIQKIKERDGIGRKRKV